MHVLFLALTVASVKVSPVQKVIELLDDLKAKVAGDLSAEETMMGEYSTWCDEEANQKTDAITSGKRTIGDLAATIQDASASIAELSSEVEELAGKISTAEKDLSTATGIREEENGAFVATEKELTETVDSLSRATAVLGRGQTFLQSSGKAELAKYTNGLKAIVQASWVNSKQKAVVQSLIQSTSEDGDEDLEMQPQATAAAYSSQGGGILDTLKDMTEKAEGSLSEARKTEMEQQHAYNMLKQSLETEIKTMKKRFNEASTEKASTEEAMNKAEEKKTETEKTVAADTAYLEELNSSCAAKASEWTERQKTAGEEMATIDKAKEILSEGVVALLEVRTHIKRDDSRRNSVVALLRKLARETRVYSFSQLAASASSDTFGKVKGLIESMINRLEEEAAQEADAKAFCDTETSKSKAKQADLTAKMDMHAVRIEKATAGIEELNVQTKKLQEEIAAMDAAQAEATKLRQDEHAAYEKASADYKQSADAVANAMSVLQEYYASGSFAQVKVLQAPEFGGAKTDVAGTIVEMLEVAESDFTRLLAESEADESAAQTAYDKLVQDNSVARAASTTEVKGNEAEVKQLNTALLNYKEDHETTGKELDAVLKYLDELKPQCETKVMSYAERKAKREQEIEGLKEALTILEG